MLPQTGSRNQSVRNQGNEDDAPETFLRNGSSDVRGHIAGYVRVEQAPGAPDRARSTGPGFLGHPDVPGSLQVVSGNPAHISTISTGLGSETVLGVNSNMRSNSPIRSHSPIQSQMDLAVAAEQATAGPAESEKDPHPVFGHGANIPSAYKFQPQLKDDETIMKEGVLFKRVMGSKVTWSKRYITLTDRGLYVRNKEGGDIRDLLDLREITHARNKCPPAVSESFKHSSMSIQDLAGSFRGGEAVARPELTRAATSQKNLQRTSSLGELSGEWIGVLEIYQEQYGRTYYLRAAGGEDKAQNNDECEAWVAAIDVARTEAEAKYFRSLNLSRQERFRRCCAAFYDHNITQAVIALLLLANFVVSILQSELDLEADEVHSRVALVCESGE